jgi:hypothetical protein
MKLRPVGLLAGMGIALATILWLMPEHSPLAATAAAGSNSFGAAVRMGRTSSSVLAGPLLQPTGAIVGSVFFDGNGNGIFDLNEAGLADIYVEAADRATGGAAFLSSATTNISGTYEFLEVPPDSYAVVQRADQFGYPASSATTPVTAEVTVLDAPVTVNFGVALPITVRGVVFQDLDNSGTQAPLSEPGLGDVPVEIYGDENLNGSVDAGESLLGSARTDSTGNYIIRDILPGPRVLRVGLPSGSSTQNGSQMALTLESVAVGGNVRVMNIPVIPAPEEPSLVCMATSLIDSRFNDKTIMAGRTIWFSARLATGGLGTVATPITFDRTKIVFLAGSTPYTVTLPAATVVYSPTATSTTTRFDTGTQQWVTTVSPGNYGKKVFLSGAALVVPAGGFPAKIQPVTWDGRFTTPINGVSLEWEWAAAVYSTFSTNYNLLGVKPVNGNLENPYPNGDAAGAPQNYTSYVVAGASGGGGSNYTGSWSEAGHAAPCAAPDVTPYLVRVNSGGTTYTDRQGRVWSADRAYKAPSWGYSGGGAKTSSSPVGDTEDDLVYQRLRENPGQYLFHAPAGDYEITLRFAEFSVANDDRTMRITIEGQIVENSFSVWQAAGRYNAVDRVYRVRLTDGVLNIVFARAAGAKRDPAVSAVEVRSIDPDATPTPTPTPTPTRTPVPTPTPTATPTPQVTIMPPADSYLQTVNCGGTTYTDGMGQTWSADRSFTTGAWGYVAGTAKSYSNAVSATSEDLLYQKLRENPGEYRFTVPNGTYEVTLRFTEFSANGPTDRLMHMTMENIVMENSLSIYGIVGRYAALDRTYLVTVGDGVLNIVFSRNGGSLSPIISAIKVRKLS